MKKITNRKLRALYSDPLQQKWYTPLSLEESMGYLNCWFVRTKGAYSKSVIVINEIKNDGTVICSEKVMITLYNIPEKVLPCGGTTIPTKVIAATDEDGNQLIGRMVHCNMLDCIGLWIDKWGPYELTVHNQAYTAIADGWKPGCFTNLGKYGTWNPV